jgi:hypothetical protein
VQPPTSTRAASRVLRGDAYAAVRERAGPRAMATQASVTEKKKQSTERTAARASARILTEEVLDAVAASSDPGPSYARLFAPFAPIEKVGVDERVEVAIEDFLDVAALEFGAVVFDQLVGLQDVGADLAAEADLGL